MLRKNYHCKNRKITVIQSIITNFIELKNVYAKQATITLFDF